MAILVIPVRPGLVRFKPMPEPLPKPKVKPLPKPKGRAKTIPPTCQYATPDLAMDAIGCQPAPEVKYVFVEGSGWQLAEPTPEPAIERPTKTEYIRQFQAASYRSGQPLPERVQRRWDAWNRIIRRYKAQKATMPRSARRALEDYWFCDLACAFDRGILGRIGYYCDRHLDRKRARLTSNPNQSKPEVTR